MNWRPLVLVSALWLVGAPVLAAAESRCLAKCGDRLSQCNGDCGTEACTEHCGRNYQRCMDSCPAEKSSPYKGPCYDQKGRKRPCKS